ncbi:glutamate formimidoyltransferase [archaeon 13_1_20CM_2_54_9]|nr:MAG: glutamate formimidoyltransferase [Crenarchaeota archaeon 13_1_40CM_3_53_5]OLE74954.1 MAG: glutamate formimidoyltransferase [archaeon 13_1_20CM_2_54_9]
MTGSFARRLAKLRLVECVPNFSEGRRKEVVDAITGEIESVPGVTLLDVESNPDHNRCVISFVGEPFSVKEAALAAGRMAVKLIDLNHHKGEHPRMGAVDVVPFVPLSGVTMEDCVGLAREFGKEFAEQLHVPVFLYEEAATTPDRHNLADVRDGEFEKLRDEIGKNPTRKPDFGPEKIHPTAGATAVGAREILIAYNANLGTSNLSVAKKIAHELRSKDGGLAFVKALGFELKERGIVQVSMNLTNFRKSQMFKAYEMVRLFAERYGVPVVGSEVVGLVPMDAIIDSAEFYLRLENFSRDQILEEKLFAPRLDTLTDHSLSLFSEEVASRKATPGGGSVSAYMGALGAGLVCMVARITLGKREPTGNSVRLTEIVSEGEKLRQKLLSLVVEDAAAFDSVIQAYKLPKDNADTRTRAIQAATIKATEVPMSTIELAHQSLKLAGELADIGTTSALSDVATAVAASMGAVEGAASNVLINLNPIKDKSYVDKISKRLTALRSEASKLADSTKKKLEHASM